MHYCVHLLDMADVLMQVSLMSCLLSRFIGFSFSFFCGFWTHHIFQSSLCCKRNNAAYAVELHQLNAILRLPDDQKWKMPFYFGIQTRRYLWQESPTAPAGAQKQGTNGGVRQAHAKYLTNKISLLPRIMFSLKVEETSNEIHCWGNVCHMRCGETAWKLLIISWKALFLVSFLPFPFPFDSRHLSPATVAILTLALRLLCRL